MFYPENVSIPEIYFNKNTSLNYFTSNRINIVQSQISNRIFNIVGILDNLRVYILINLGCGTGITEHFDFFKKNFVIGIDISFFMLKIYSNKYINNDSILMDIETTLLPFRYKSGDIFISISCIQWLKKCKNLIRSYFDYPKHYYFRCIKNSCVVQFFIVSKQNTNELFKIYKKGKKNNFLIKDSFCENISKKYYLFCNN